MRLNRALILLAIACFTATLATAQTRYHVTDAGPFEPNAINQGGMIAGDSFNGYAYDPRYGLFHIPGFHGYDTRAYSANASGQVVGESDRLINGAAVPT